MPKQQSHRAPIALSCAAALAVIAGSALSACESDGTSGTTRYRPYQGTPTPSQPAQSDVNSGLATLSAKTPPPSLIEGEPPAEENVAQVEQIAESARLLDEYFSKGASNASTLASNTPKTSGYDPSAELGPTGSSRFAHQQPAEATNAARPPETSSGLMAFQESDDPAVDSVLAAIDSANTSGQTARPAATVEPSTRVVDATPAQTRDTASQQNRVTNPAIRIENAPEIRVSDATTGTTMPAMRVVEPSTPQTNTPAATRVVSPEVPTQAVTSADSIDAALERELANDPVLSSIVSAQDRTPAREPATTDAGGSLQGRPVEDTRPIASADGALPRTSLKTPEQRKNELVDELVAVLGEIAHASDEPYRMGLALAGLETLSPGALYELTESGVLMPDEVRTLLAAHEFLSGLSAGGGLPDPGSVSDLLGDVKERLDEHAPLKITAAELCTRVMGYGQYDMFPKAADGSYRFVAGRRQPVILYVEVDRFGRRPKVGDDGLARWEVALSQSLEIYHDADDLLVMARDAETDVSLSRNKIRDYYLINQTYLPENLTIGRYNLKVTMRDENKQAVATSIIPVTIVPTTGGFAPNQ